MFTNFMQLALSQAFLSIGESRPNPSVGAVVVKNGIVVGKGRTQRPGFSHAEVMALRDAGELACGAAIFVTLEPCCHYGRTPPCTKAIIDAGIKQVFFAHSDPNPLVRGKSRRILEDAGIEVYEGVNACIEAKISESWEDTFGNCHCLRTSLRESERLEFSTDVFSDNVSNIVKRDAFSHYLFKEIERFYEAYDYFVCNKRTFVEIKCSISQDGFMGMVCPDGSNAPLKITGENANCWNHELRSMSDAVLVGAGTLFADNPNLNVRYAQGNDPMKIIWAGHHEFSAKEIAKLNVFIPLHHLQKDSINYSLSRNANQNKKKGSILIFSCVPQPLFSSFLTTSISLEVIYLNRLSFVENWCQMIDNLSYRGLHRLMVEPGNGLVFQLFKKEFQSHKIPLWNRLDVWQSCDCSVEKKLEESIVLGFASKGLEFPELPENIIAKESLMAGPDVLTSYYPNFDV